MIFHAGTQLRDGVISTAGGRVLTAIGKAATMEGARASAYKLVRSVKFTGKEFRTDIAQF